MVKVTDIDVSTRMYTRAVMNTAEAAALKDSISKRGWIDSVVVLQEKPGESKLTEVLMIHSVVNHS